jgi:TP901 family phage tail tape measure protein
MAGNIKGITIEIDGETKGLSKALGDVNKQSRDLQKELKGVETLLKLDPKNTELVAQKQKILSEQVEVTKQKLDRLKDAQVQVNEQYRKGEIGEEQYRDFQREIVATEQKLKSYEDQLDEVSKGQSKLKDAVAKTGESLKSIGTKMTDVGKTMSMKVTAPIVAAGAAAIKMSNDFDASMANVATLIPGNVDRVNELKDAVQDMAVDVGKHTGDLADGLYQVISAFGDTADTAKILEINAKAAAAGVATTTDAINLTSAVTKGYGDTTAEAVGKVSDLAFTTVKLGQTTFPELASSIGRVTPLAASLGLSMEELFGVMATATGVTGSAAEVSTQLRGVLQSLMAPTDSMTKLIKKMGFESGAAMLEQLGLQETINTVVNAAEKSNTPLQKYIGSIEGQTLALALAGPQAESFTEKLNAMKDVSGATDEAFKEQTEGINAAGFQWEQFKIKIETTAQDIGDKLAPALSNLLSKISELVDRFTELSPKQQDMILKIGALAAVLGPALVVTGKFVSAIGDITKGLAPLVGKLPGATVAVGKFIGKFATGSLDAIKGFGSAIVDVATSAGSFASKLGTDAFNAVTSFGSAIGDGVAKLGEFVGKLAVDGLQAAGNFASKIGEGALKIGEFATKLAVDGVKAVASFAVQLATTAWSAITSFVGAMGGAIASAWSFTAALLANPITWIVAAILGLIAVIILLWKNWDDVSKFLTETWNKIKEVGETVWNGLKDFFAGVWEAITAKVKEVWNGIKEFLSGLWEGIKATASSIWEGIKNAIIAPINAAKTLLTQVWNAIKKFVSDLWNSIKSKASEVWEGIKNAIMTPINSAKMLLSDAWNSIKTTASNLWNGIKNTANTVWEGIKTNIMTPINSVKKLLSDVWGGITKSATDAWNGLKKSASTIFNNVKDAILAPFKNLHIPLPHFKFSTKQVNVAGLSFPVPNVKIDWYKKGGIFTQPSIIGVGEAGAEAVVPIDKLSKIMADTLKQMNVQTTAGHAIVVQNMTVRDDQDIELISQRLYSMIQSTSRARGMR